MYDVIYFMIFEIFDVRTSELVMVLLFAPASNWTGSRGEVRPRARCLRRAGGPRPADLGPRRRAGFRRDHGADGAALPRGPSAGGVRVQPLACVMEVDDVSDGLATPMLLVALFLRRTDRRRHSIESY